MLTSGRSRIKKGSVMVRISRHVCGMNFMHTMTIQVKYYFPLYLAPTSSCDRNAGLENFACEVFGNVFLLAPYCSVLEVPFSAFAVILSGSKTFVA